MLIRLIAPLTVTVLLVGCASNVRLLMPTPAMYLASGGQPVFDQAAVERLRPEVDLLYLTDRAPQTDPQSTLPYGQERDRAIAFGSAQVRIVPQLSGEALDTQSRLDVRTEEVALEMGPIRELGRFPQEPYEVTRSPTGELFRAPDVLEAYDAAKQQLVAEIQRRLAESPKKEIVLYVHGFNETFATAAFTTAELCHFLGREDVCAFFTWPASSSGNFLISYTSTTESAQYAVNHLKKVLRILTRTPGVEKVHLLAHSRGTAVLLAALRELVMEAIAAGIEPVDEFRIGEVVLLSPDIDVGIAGQQLTAYASDPDMVSVWPERRLPRSIGGRMTFYSSPEDRALRVAQILFRSRDRVGQLRPEDIPPATQAFLAKIGRLDLIVYEGKRTDLFGHSYFTTNPKVSSDLIQMIRYGKKIGEPGRELIQTGPVTWMFPGEAATSAGTEQIGN
jgi:esterase/lipase superfamily enzyme